MAGAGFVVFRIFPEGVKFLGLVGPEFQRNRCNGKYDIPKGTVDLGETPFQTAVREAEEEAGYSIASNNIVSGPFRDGLLTIWLAQVFSDPIIVPNPHSGIIEQEGHEWLEPQDLLGNCYNYLQPTLEWACGEIKNGKVKTRP